jgi:hypothetical protein
MTRSVLAALALVLARPAFSQAPPPPIPAQPPAPSQPSAPSQAPVPPPPGPQTSPAPPTAPDPRSGAGGRLAAPGAAPSASVLMRGAVAVEPTGARIPLGAEEAVVDPAAKFRVDLGAPVSDGRLVLLDAADAMVPGTGTREVGDTTAFTLAPASPLTPGTRYVLRLDGARTRDLHDAAGKAFSPVTMPILVAGERPPPPPKATPKKKKRARRR